MELGNSGILTFPDFLSSRLTVRPVRDGIENKENDHENEAENEIEGEHEVEDPPLPPRLTVNRLRKTEGEAAPRPYTSHVPTSPRPTSPRSAAPLAHSLTAYGLRLAG